VRTKAKGLVAILRRRRRRREEDSRDEGRHSIISGMVWQHATNEYNSLF